MERPMKKRACDACARRKIQCDRERPGPACDWCYHHNMECTWNRPISTKRRKRNAVVAPPPPRGRPAPLLGRLHFAGRHLGEISLHNGMPFLSWEGRMWIASRTGDPAPFKAVCEAAESILQRHHLHPSMLCGTAAQPNLDLPDRKAIEEALCMYSATPFKRIWPVIDAVLFQQTIEVAYNPQTACLQEWATAKACIFAFLALLAIHHKYPPSLPILDGEECAVKAQCLLAQVLQETTLVGLQTCFLLALYHLMLGQLQKAAVYNSLACRMLFTLGGHTIVVPLPKSPPSLDWRYDNQLRKMFWMLYSCDKEISLRTGQPPSINDDDCDLTLPHGYVEAKYLEEDMQEADAALLNDTAVPLFPGDLRLDMLKSKTYQLLYSARALRKSDAELIRDIRELDDELEAWRLAVPPTFRPWLSLRHDQPTSMSELRHMERVMVYVEYHRLIAAIHAATGRCSSWSTDKPFEMPEGVGSSMALAVEASRSTLFFIKAIVQNLMGEVFWMAVIYPISAVWTIFCNIIYNPMHAHVDGDLELLNWVPQLIQDMRKRRLARDEMVHMRMIDDFVAELARLAGEAVKKARRDHRSASSASS